MFSLFFWNEGSTCCANARVCGHGVVPEVVFLVDLVASLWWTKVEFIVSDHWRLVRALPLPLPTLPTFYGDGKMKLNCLRCLNRPPTSSIPMRHGHGIRKPGLHSKDLLLACETLWNSVKCAALPYSSYVNLALGRPTSFLQVFLAWVFAPFMCLTLSSDFQTLRADHVFFESQVSRASHANQAHRRYWCSLERKVKIGGKFGCSRCWHAAWRGPVRKKAHLYPWLLKGP